MALYSHHISKTVKSLYRIFPDHVKLKKKTALRMKRNLKRVQRLYAEGKIDLDRAQKTVTSYMGLLSHCDSYQLRRAIFGEYTETERVDGWFYLQRNSDLIEEKKDEEPVQELAEAPEEPSEA